jgi:hypothetical protein
VLDVVVFKAAQDVDDRIHFADVAQELVAQPFALGCAAHQPGNVDKAELGGDDLLAAGDLGQRSSRASGTPTLPTLGSIVQNG